MKDIKKISPKLLEQLREERLTKKEAIKVVASLRRAVWKERDIWVESYEGVPKWAWNITYGITLVAMILNLFELLLIFRII